jgi:hypothetical protein
MVAAGARVAVVIQSTTPPVRQEILGVTTDRQVATVTANMAKLTG